MKTKIYTTILLLALGFSLNAQNVAISNDNSTPDPSAMLDVKSSSKGLLIPRVVLTNVNTALPVTDPAHGLFVFSENGAVPDGLYYWNDTDSKWIYVVTANDITDFGSGQVITDAERTKLNSDADSDTTNELQTLNLNSNELTISSASGNTVTFSNWDTDISNDITTADITDLGSGAIISTSERTKLNSLQNNPTGTILVFAGETLPEGYLWCDGAPYIRNEYSDLFTAIGVSWGAGDGSITFNVPDLRGYFLRGMDRDNGTGLANNDPDIANRTNINGTTVGNVVGSYQVDELKSHNHTYYGAHSSAAYGTLVFTQGQSGLSQAVSTTGGNETRPKNAYVNYIIKY